MNVSDFLAARAGDIIQHAMSTMATRHLEHYERLGAGETEARLRAMLQLVVECTRTRDLVPVVEHAARIGRERYESGFEFIEVQGALSLLEEAIWRTLLAGFPPAELGEALGVVSTIFGAAKDKLASTYVSLATGKHVPSLDLNALFRGTQNTGGGAQ